MSIYEQGETYAQYEEIRDRDGTLVDPSSCSITITSPCGAILVDLASMVQDDTGMYHYFYAIAADASYGKYETKVTAIDGSGNVTSWIKEFYIFPWNIINEVRINSGIKTKKSISDNDISALIWEAYNEALDEVYEFHHWQGLRCNPDTGAWIDGTNTVFATKHGDLADKDGDGVIRGYGEASCGTDVNGWWKDENGDCHRVNITINDAKCGNITVTQLDGTAIPTSAEWVRINYYTEYETYDERIFRSAVAYLAAYKCTESFKALDKATVADLRSNKQDVYLNKNRMEKAYKRAMRKVKKPNISGGMIPGEC